DLVMILPERYTLERGCLEQVTELFADAQPQAAAFSVLLHTPDGLGRRVWQPGGLDVTAVLADPRSVAPVLCLRRQVWTTLSGLDEMLNQLAGCELWLRLLLGGYAVRLVADALTARELIDEDAPDEQAHLREYRAVLEKHREAAEQAMAGILVAREIAFGVARNRHAELGSARDDELAELDPLPAPAAH